jgi:hypothetical protein
MFGLFALELYLEAPMLLLRELPGVFWRGRRFTTAVSHSDAMSIGNLVNTQP